MGAGRGGGEMSINFDSFFSKNIRKDNPAKVLKIICCLNLKFHPFNYFAISHNRYTNDNNSIVQVDVVYIPPYPEPDKKPIHLPNLESWEDKPGPPLLNKSDFYSVSQPFIVYLQ